MTSSASGNTVFVWKAMFSFAWSQHEIHFRKFYTPPDLVSFIIAAGVVALCPLAAAVVADAWNSFVQGVTVLRPGKHPSWKAWAFGPEIHNKLFRSNYDSLILQSLVLPICTATHLFSHLCSLSLDLCPWRNGQLKRSKFWCWQSFGR